MRSTAQFHKQFPAVWGIWIRICFCTWQKRRTSLEFQHQGRGTQQEASD